MEELNSITLSDFTKLADVIFGKMKDSVPMVARSSGLFLVEQIPNATGDTREYSEIDKELYAKRKGQGEQAARAKVQQGYSKTIRAARVSLDIGITVEWRKYGKYQEVKSALQSLGTHVPNRMELDLQHRITFMTATAYTNMDGESVDITMGDTLAFLSTAHTVRGTSTTYRNRLATNPQFSRGSLESMEQMASENSINQYGQKVPLPPTGNVIWTTDDAVTVNAVREFLNSTASPESGVNNGVVNVYQGKYRHIIFPLVATDKDGAVDTTKRKYWGIAFPAYSQAHLLVWEEAFMKADPRSGNNAEDFQTENWEFGTAGSYGIGIVSAGWFFASTGDATA
jgi:hypothetical protein